MLFISLLFISLTGPLWLCWSNHPHNVDTLGQPHPAKHPFDRDIREYSGIPEYCDLGWGGKWPKTQNCQSFQTSPKHFLNMFHDVLTHI